MLIVSLCGLNSRSPLTREIQKLEFDTNIEKLLQVMDTVRDHAPVDVSRWFMSGIELYMDGEKLDDCLGLSIESGSRHPAKLYYMHKRNSALCDAWLFCAEHDDKRTETLIEKIPEFEQFYWPDHKHLKAPPEKWTELRSQLFWAFHYAAMRGVSVPRSKRQINEIVGRLRTGSPIDPLALWCNPILD